MTEVQVTQSRIPKADYKRLSNKERKGTGKSHIQRRKHSCVTLVSSVSTTVTCFESSMARCFPSDIGTFRADVEEPPNFKTIKLNASQLYHFKLS